MFNCRRVFACRVCHDVALKHAASGQHP
jgi:hypothetical protein